MRRPDAHRIPPPHPPRHEPARHHLALGPQLPVGEPAIRMGHHEGLPVAKAAGGVLKVLEDGLAQKRGAAGTVNVAELAQSRLLPRAWSDTPLCASTQAAPTP